jgi:hypothetical protein
MTQRTSDAGFIHTPDSASAGSFQIIPCARMLALEKYLAFCTVDASAELQSAIRMFCLDLSRTKVWRRNNP